VDAAEERALRERLRAHQAYPNQRERPIQIIADRNFNQQQIGLANSEVLFLQYRAVGFTERAHSLKRQLIQNAETLQVTAESFRRSAVNPATSAAMVCHTHEARGAMFYALLGTPNGRAAAYLVIGHGADFGIIGVDRIEHQRLDGRENMFLTFTPDEAR